MGHAALALEQEFERTTQRFEQSNPSAANVVNQLTPQRSSRQIFDANLREYRRTVDDADREAKIAVASVRKLLKEHDDEDDLAYLTQDAIPRLIAQVDQRMDEVERIFQQLINEKDRSLQQGKLSYANDLKRAGKEIRRHGEILARHRRALISLAWDFDPEARGGESFDNVDDLIASLNS